MTGPGHAVTRLAVRHVYRGALIVTIVAAGMSAIVADQYRTTFAGAMDSGALRALAGNPAIRILFGPPGALDDPGGFTVWRTGTAIMVLVGVWALLRATRLTRGDEDAGRTDLLLAGRLTPAILIVRRFAVLSGASAVAGIAVAVALVASGATLVGAVSHGACVMGAGMTFTVMGILAAQVMPSRPAASGLAAGVLATTLLARMLADGVDELRWLAWITPFGLAGQAAPFAANQVAPLVILFLLPLGVFGAALLAIRHRDTGEGMVRLSTSRPPRTRLLGSLIGFAVRRAVWPTAGWSLGISAYFLLIGSLITSIGQFLTDNPRFAELAGAAGFGGLGAPIGFSAAMATLLSIPVGLFAASRLAGVTSDETAGRATLLLALPVSRVRHAFTEIAVSAVAALIPLLAAALALWLGALISNAPLGLGPSLAGVLNIAPVALLSLGAAAFAHGWVPRAVMGIGAIPTAGGFLLYVVAQSVQAPAWLAAISPYAHVAQVPTAPPDWLATAAIVSTAGVFVALGIFGYSRRDLTSD